jgi:hypothetical protein
LAERVGGPLILTYDPLWSQAKWDTVSLLIDDTNGTCDMPEACQTLWDRACVALCPQLEEWSGVADTGPEIRFIVLTHNYLLENS